MPRRGSVQMTAAKKIAFDFKHVLRI